MFAMPAKSIAVELYTRKGCHLCDVAKDVIERVRARRSFELKVIDVDTDAGLQERFGLEVPVIFVGGKKHAKYRLDENGFEERLVREATSPATTAPESDGPI